MIAIGRYLVFIISLAGTMLSVDISPEDKQTFLRYIHKLHNDRRIIHKTNDLHYNDKMCEEASNILENVILNDIAISHSKYGMNISWRPFDNNTKLDNEEANIIFSKWYNKRNKYDYKNEPSSTDTDSFTRIVWNETTDFGIAIAFRETDYVVLALYSPPGNKEKQFKNNVFDPEESSSLADNSSLNN